MIPIEALAAVRSIITHHRGDSLCADAVASAIIVRDVLPDAAVHFVQYGAELASVAPRPGCLFLDIAPTPETAKAHVEAGAIVLDHHRTARTVVDLFGERGVFADENADLGVSGAVLAFREVWRPLAYRGGQRPKFHAYEGRAANAIQQFAMLAGVADTYQKNSPLWQQASEQAAALSFWEWSDYPAIVFNVDGYSEDFQPFLDIGRTLRQKNQRFALDMIQLGMRYSTDAGTRVLIVPTRKTTDIAEIAAKDFDLVVGFEFGRTRLFPKLVVSTRSPMLFDCEAFCVAHGGGGHQRAAGFEMVLYEHTPQPFALLLERIEAWERIRLRHNIWK